MPPLFAPPLWCHPFSRHPFSRRPTLDDFPLKPLHCARHSPPARCLSPTGAPLLPAQLLWHGNESALTAGPRSNCNLPSVCNRCRGKDGKKRPVASLSAALPCGFCRCGADLHKPPYITLPH